MSCDFDGMVLWKVIELNVSGLLSDRKLSLFLGVWLRFVRKVILWVVLMFLMVVLGLIDLYRVVCFWMCLM